ncbi:serine/threonine phosphatase PrpC [Vulgatibacter incomptus]|uniref:Serine/threonine phosphatase PrpC n=2 Tax=Vulgatibacter incomptus TaxID=1391653 RepID=A0A0K1PDH4_9BACT|nr:serine/threonine phosphatase PrpC [Vulgatibacter incomptus]
MRVGWDSMKVASFGATDVGRRRKDNEDAFLADDELGLYAVCDGMGGHAAGEVAAARTLEVIREHVAAHADVVAALAADPSPKSGAAAVQLVEAAIQRACAEVYRLAQADASKRGMGTTCVALIVSGEKGVIGHVGDSRIYLVRGGQVHRLTEDHTLVQAQLKQGVITREQAETSPYRNVITRAVGIQESVHVDTLLTDVQADDVFILCSDGLCGYVDDEETSAVFTAAPASMLPRSLIDLANERGGRDNITVITVHAQGAAGQVGEAEARIDALRRIPLFMHLSYKEQMAALAIANSRSFEAGEPILNEGEPGAQLFVVVKGKVAVEAGGTRIAEIGRGGHFGEMGLIEPASRSASVRALEPTRCIELGRTELMALMRKEPVLAVKLLWSLVQALSERLRSTSAELSGARQELSRGAEGGADEKKSVRPFGETGP